LAVIKITFSEEEMKLLKNISNNEHIPENVLVKKLVLDGLEKHKIDEAVSMYEKKKANLNTAAWIAGLPVRDFMNELESRGVSLNLTPEMIDYSLEILTKTFDNKKLHKIIGQGMDSSIERK